MTTVLVEEKLDKNQKPVIAEAHGIGSNSISTYSVIKIQSFSNNFSISLKAHIINKIADYQTLS